MGVGSWELGGNIYLIYLNAKIYLNIMDSYKNKEVEISDRAGDGSHGGDDEEKSDGGNNNPYVRYVGSGVGSGVGGDGVGSGVDGDDHMSMIDRVDDIVDDVAHSTVNIGKKVGKMGLIVGEKVGDNVEDFYHGWKKFVFKDSIINIAVGMIVARSFKNTVNSVVVDIIMPVLLGFGVGANVHDLFIVLVDGKEKKNMEKNGIYNFTYITLEDAKRDGAVTLNYGLFINIFFDLIFVTLCLYLSLRIIYRVKKIKRNVKKNVSIGAKTFKEHLLNE